MIYLIFPLFLLLNRFHWSEKVSDVPQSLQFKIDSCSPLFCFKIFLFPLIRGDPLLKEENVFWRKLIYM